MLNELTVAAIRAMNEASIPANSFVSELGVVFGLSSVTSFGYWTMNVTRCSAPSPPATRPRRSGRR